MTGQPRVPAGSSTGGQFMAYDAKSKTGTGYGKRGGDANVKELQGALKDLGFTDSKGRPLDLDGKLGPLTTQAVKKAQRALGVPADGRVTPALLAKIKAMPKPAAVAKPKPAAKKKATARAKIATRAAPPPVRAQPAARPKPATQPARAGYATGTTTRQKAI